MVKMNKNEKVKIKDLKVDKTMKNINWVILIVDLLKVWGVFIKEKIVEKKI